MSPPPWRRIWIICNPNSGKKGGLPTNWITPEAVHVALAVHDLRGEFILSTSTAAAQASARAAIAAGCDLIIAAGGDGTVGTIATELLGSETALGILPLGSVMNIVRSLGLPRELNAAAAIIAQGVTRRIDVGEAAGRPFFEGGSVGMNAAIFREAQRIDRGDWRGLVASIWVALRYNPARMRLYLDDRVLQTRALMVTISNGPYTGLGFTVAPQARLGDGLFDVHLFQGFSRWELLRYLAAIAFGKRRYSPKISSFRSSHVRVTSVHPLPCRADATDLGHTPVTFRIRHSMLRVVVAAETPTD
jgi:diacylglycerol kinase (ATP)